MAVREVFLDHVQVANDVGGVGGDVVLVVGVPPPRPDLLTAAGLRCFLGFYRGVSCYMRERKLIRFCKKWCVKRTPNGRGSVF